MRGKKREYTYDEYKNAMELLKKGYSEREICRILGWPETKKSTIHYWKHGRVSPIARWVAKPSRELGYIIGALNDGCVNINKSKHTYRIKFGVIDRDFAVTISTTVSKLLNKKIYRASVERKEEGMAGSILFESICYVVQETEFGWIEEVY